MHYLYNYHSNSSSVRGPHSHKGAQNYYYFRAPGGPHFYDIGAQGLTKMDPKGLEKSMSVCKTRYFFPAGAVYVVLVSFAQEFSSELDILDSIWVENVSWDSTPPLMPPIPADKECINEYWNPTLVVSNLEMVNFTPVVILNSLVMSLVPFLDENKNIHD